MSWAWAGAGCGWLLLFLNEVDSQWLNFSLLNFESLLFNSFLRRSPCTGLQVRFYQVMIKPRLTLAASCWRDFVDCSSYFAVSMLISVASCPFHDFFLIALFVIFLVAFQSVARKK
jgi:hypothetical protein